MKSLFFFAKSLSFSRIYHVFTLFIANSVRIHLVFRKFTLQSFLVSRIRCQVRINIMNFLSFSRIHFEFPIFLVYSLCINYILPEFTKNSLFLPEYTLVSPFFCIDYELTIFFANSLWIHSFLREFTCERTIWRTHYEFTCSFAKLPWIHYESTIYLANRPWIYSVSPLHYKFTVFFAT